MSLVTLAAAILGLMLAWPSERPHSAAARETSQQGVIARLPFVGTLSWRCDARRRFSTTLTLPSPGATVTIGLVADGRRLWRNRRVDPASAPQRTVAGPFRARRSQTWTIRYHHMPATLEVIARLRFAAPLDRAQCVVSRAALELRRTPH